jgi:hypothetical protein
MKRRTFSKSMLSVPAVMTLSHGQLAMASIGVASENQALNSFCANGPTSPSFISFMDANPTHPGFTAQDCIDGGNSTTT